MVVQVNNENFEQEIAKSELPVIVDFWASWCGPCQMMGPVFEEVSKDYEGKLKFAKISTEESPDLATKYNITGIPCLVVMKGREEVERIVGFAPKPMLKQKIDAVMEKL